MNIIVVLFAAACQVLANQQQADVKANESRENGVLVVRYNIFAADVPVVGAMVPAPALASEIVIPVFVQPAVNENYVIDRPSKYVRPSEMSQDEVRRLSAYHPKTDWSYQPKADWAYRPKTDWTYHARQE